MAKKGDFQMEAEIARKMGLIVSKKNDERFDLDASSAAAAKYMKTLDNNFKKESIITANTKTIAVNNAEERKKFDMAAYNGGSGRIAEAQNFALAAGDDPTKWDNVKDYLEKAGATKDKANEIREYVDKILAYEEEFKKGSKANADSKFKRAGKLEPYPSGSHWITLNGRHILIKD